MHVTLRGPEGMLLAKSNSTKRARPPTFKEGVNAPKAHGFHVIHVYHAFEFEGVMSQVVWRSLHDTCDWDGGLHVPKVP